LFLLLLLTAAHNRHAVTTITISLLV